MIALTATASLYLPMIHLSLLVLPLSIVLRLVLVTPILTHCATANNIPFLAVGHKERYVYATICHGFQFIRILQVYTSGAVVTEVSIRNAEYLFYSATHFGSVL